MQDEECHDFIIVLCSLSKQADPRNAIHFDKNFKVHKKFEPKSIGLEQSFNVLVESF